MTGVVSVVGEAGGLRSAGVASIPNVAGVEGFTSVEGVADVAGGTFTHIKLLTEFNRSV